MFLCGSKNIWPDPARISCIMVIDASRMKNRISPHLSSTKHGA